MRKAGDVRDSGGEEGGWLCETGRQDEATTSEDVKLAGNL